MSPSLTIDGAIFNKNKIGINIIGYSVASSPYPFDITNTVFTCRDLKSTSTFWPYVWPTLSSLKTIVNTGTLSEHYAVGDIPTITLQRTSAGNITFEGIYLEDVGTGAYYDITIGGSNTNETMNVFDNMKFGINVLNSNLTCYNNGFQYILTPIVHSPGGYAINASSTGDYSVFN
jgi:hypothetical protein